MHYSTTFLYAFPITNSVSATLIPQRDPELLSELEEDGKTDELKALAHQALEEAEITREYDITYRKDHPRTEEQAGTVFTSHEISPYYDGSKDDIQLSLETDVDEFYASLDGEFRLIDSDGEERTYKLVMSCDSGILVKGEIESYGEIDLIYIHGDEDNLTQLQAHLDGKWTDFGISEGPGKGNHIMTDIEALDSAYRQLLYKTDKGDNGWKIKYSSSLENDLQELPPQVESTLENKTANFEQNLALGVSPENIFSVMSPPWKPLLEMKLGNDYRAMFITSSNLPQDQIPGEIQGPRNLVGLSVEPKKEFKQKFRLEGDNQVKGGIDYALRSVNES